MLLDSLLAQDLDLTNRKPSMFSASALQRSEPADVRQSDVIIEIPATRVCYFKPGKELRELDPRSIHRQ